MSLKDSQEDDSPKSRGSLDSPPGKLTASSKPKMLT